MRFVWLLLLCGCATFTGARPLEPGQHEVGATFGGPLVEAFGTVIPLPMFGVQGRSGLTRVADRPLDLSYGINATGLAFGVVALHVGNSYLLVHPDGAVPAVSVTNRVFFATNPVDPGTAEGGRGVALADQIELAVSYEVGGQLLYTSVSESIDLRNPGLLLTPRLGAVIDFREPGHLRLHAEVQWWGANFRPQTDRVPWFPGGRGALGASLGVSWAFGEAR